MEKRVSLYTLSGNHYFGSANYDSYDKDGHLESLIEHYSNKKMDGFTAVFFDEPTGFEKVHVVYDYIGYFEYQGTYKIYYEWKEGTFLGE